MDSSPLHHQGSFRIFFTLHLWRKLLWKPLLQTPELFSPFPILLSPKDLSLWTCHRFTYWHCFLPVSPALECKLHGCKDTCFLVNCYAKLNKYLLHERNQQMNEHYQRQMTWGRTNITCRTPFKKWQPWNKTVCISLNLFNICQLAHLGESYFNMYILCFNASVVFLFWSNSGDLGNTINFSMLKAFKPSLKHCSSPSCQTLSINELFEIFSAKISLFKWEYFGDGPSLVAQRVKHLPEVWEIWVRSLGQEDLLEKEMATHSSILAWRIPWMEEPGRLQSTGSQRVRHDWVTSLFSTSEILLFEHCLVREFKSRGYE